MSFTLRSSFLASVIFVAACGGKSAPVTTTTGGGGGAAETAPPADMAFKDMSSDQRMAFMKLSVTPAMKAAFQEFDAKKYAEFNCKTCHGKGAVDGSFEMPNPDLPRLPKPEDFPAYAKDHGPMIEFMAKKVEPGMAKLLKMTPYDPTTNTGDFSCGACHMQVGQEAAPPHEHKH